MAEQTIREAMKMDFDMLLFSELRLVSVAFDNTELSDNTMVKAMTVNEELLKLGYALAPKDIVTLARSSNADSFVERVKGYIGKVKAKPMYPGFPEQVMAMDKAVFRFHQLLHYMSTYGIELITGESVVKGWMPQDNSAERNLSDDRLLSAKVIALVDKREKFTAAYSRILSKTERMTNKERAIIRECAQQLSPAQLTAVEILFKQNLLDVFSTVFFSPALSSQEKLGVLHSLCQHTGDVFKCVDFALTRAGFHFRTSQKKLIVRLLESYPVSDFKENLILSNKKSERTELMLRYTDYNEYSRSSEHKQAVASLRNGELRSWESRAKYLVSIHSDEALDYYSQRPGMMLRSLTYLARHAYSPRDMLALLEPKAAGLKTQSLVSLVSHFSRPYKMWSGGADYAEALTLREVAVSLLRARLSANRTVLENKKVFIKAPEFDLGRSAIRVTDRSSEGGYIRSGLAYRIPDQVRKIRFFVYWNDKKRVDIDLHANAVKLNGENIPVGWNADFKTDELVFSGDITHSNAAEYIDLDLDVARDTIDCVTANINIYSGYDSFAKIDECFVGAMAVSKTGEKIKHYDPKNCFFSHFLKGNYRMINYGYVDVSNRLIVFDGVENDRSYYSSFDRNNSFSVMNYLSILFETQGAVVVDGEQAADIILVMGKPAGENEVSIIDNNFFMEQLD